MMNNDPSGEPPESGKPPRGKARRRTIDLTANEVSGERTDLAATQSHQQAGEMETSAPAVSSQDAEAGAQQADADQSAARPNAEPSYPGSEQDLSARPERVQPRVPILWPLLAGGAAGAAGAVLALVLASLFTVGDASALAARLARLEQQFREWTARPWPAGMEARMLDEIAGRVAKLEAALATTTPDLAVANRISMLEGER